MRSVHSQRPVQGPAMTKATAGVVDQAERRGISGIRIDIRQRADHSARELWDGRGATRLWDGRGAYPSARRTGRYPPCAR